jgi:hypothetical protein
MRADDDLSHIIEDHDPDRYADIDLDALTVNATLTESQIAAINAKFDAQRGPQPEWFASPVVVTTKESKFSEKAESTDDFAGLVTLYREYAKGATTDHRHSLISYSGNNTKGKSAEVSYGVIVEVDEGGFTLDQAESQLKALGIAAIMYTTKSHTPERHRFRVVVPLAYPIDIRGEEVKRYAAIVRHVGGKTCGMYDSNCEKVWELQRLPTCGAEIRIIDGVPLDPSEVPGGADGGVPLVDETRVLVPRPQGPREANGVTAVDLEPLKSRDEVMRMANLLAQVAVMHGKSYWGLRPGGTWQHAERGTITSRLKRFWSDGLDHKLIDAVLSQNLLPEIDGIVASPVGSQFVMFNGRFCLNPGIHPKAKAKPLGDHGRILIEFVNRVICNDARPLDEIMREVETGEAQSVTRWVWHWIAAQYQRPAVALDTALWLISSTHGTGKSSFANLLAKLIGDGNSTKPGNQELDGQWSDFMVGKSLVVCEEPSLSDHKHFYKMSKEWIGNSTVSARKRHVGSMLLPATATWLFITNDVSPLNLEKSDRRHMMISVLNDKTQTDAIFQRLEDAGLFRSKSWVSDDAVSELAGWLASITVDDRLIRTALITETKRAVTEDSMDYVETWLRAHVAEDWDTNEFKSADELFADFMLWAPKQGIRNANLRWFNKSMRRLGEYVQATHSGSRRGFRLVSIPEGVEQIERTESDNIVQFRKKFGPRARMGVIGS